ncbi:MAG: NifU family protein [marine benthic group bacterium]|nr:NifU family protein [Gemmatimonadota bacterium]MCL7964642.1 NifU family protein [Gemmatimonadota bacterium]MCL7966800.1 NifU family protein [Gemmatimonadota bacterium]MCL7970411.1 NifU family protein [Gemmatimonadota bacterium]MCL7973233.1 NifU family protein [Gemmatimonadota bacterium]
MITFTDQARERVLAFMEMEDGELAVRIEVLDSSPLAPRYDLALIETSEGDDGDRRLDGGGFPLLVDAGSAELLEGATVDWVETLQGSGFKVDNPNIKPIGENAPQGPLADRVKHVIEHQINPSIAGHGGAVALVDVRDEVVYLEMHGGCQGCGMAAVTLAQGIRRILMESLPEIREIVDVTNHEAGANPYY